MEKQTRIAKWDNVKLFLIACVVIGHILSKQLDKTYLAKQIYFCMYLFHMPAFVIVSGLFSKRTIREKNYDKTFRFFLLYLFVAIAVFGTRFLVYGKRNLELIHVDGVAWYALAMFVFYLVTMFLQQYNKWYVLGLAVVLSCAAGYDPTLKSFLSISRILVFYPFFLLGFYAEPDQIIQWTRKHWVKLAAAALVAAVMLYGMKHTQSLYWIMRLLKGKDPYNTLQKWNAYGGILRLIQLMGSSVLSFAIFALIPERKFFFSVMGQRTLTIYALHFVLIDIFYGALKGNKLVQQLWPEHPTVLIVMAGLLILVVLSWKPLDRIVTGIISPKRCEEKK